MKMNIREDAFQTKFKDAAKQLNALPDKVVSLKVREIIGDYHEYKELLGVLQRDTGLNHSSINGNYQGTGHLVGNSKTKIIVVEHETGLEILYIAGSISSIVGLIPLTLQCWRAIRSHIGRPHHLEHHMLEIRRMDSRGRLIEEKNHGMGFSINQSLLSAAEDIDGEMQQLKTTVESFSDRISALEKKLTNQTSKQKVKRRNKKKSKG